MESKETLPPIDKFLVKTYGTFEILDLTLEEGLDFYVEGIRLREEERLYSFWEQLKTSMGGHEVPSYTQFLKEVLGAEDTTKEEKTHQRLGKIKGDDITR